jgi:hypothetical protein
MSKDQDPYNGWTNYETWVTALWIDNEESTYNERGRIVHECVAAAVDPSNVNISVVADALKAWAEESFIDPVTEASHHADPERELAGLAIDLLRAAWSEVNWYEIAVNWLMDAEYPAEVSL